MPSAAGPGLALLSSAIWGAGDVGGGLAARRIPAVAVVAWQQSFGLVAVAVVVVLTSAWTAGAGWVPWALLAGVAGSSGLVAVYAALSTGTMGVVSPIAALGAVVPVLVGVLSGERPGALQVAGIVVAVGGAALAGGPDLSAARSAPSRARPLLLAAVAAVCFGTALVAIAHGSGTSTLMTLLGMRVTSVTAFVVAALVLRTAGGVGRRDLPLLVAIGLADAGANLLFGLSTTMGLLSLTSVAASLYPVVTVLVARFVLHERLSRVQAVGVVAALAGVVLIATG